jgi:hypothetical protein
MPYSRRQSTSAEEQTYASRLDLVTRRLDTLIHLIHNDDGYPTALNLLLDDAINLHKDAKTRKRDDIDDALRLLDRVVMVLTAVEERAKVDREARETSGLREYTVLLLVVSEWSARFGPHVYTRAGRAYVKQAGELIGIAIDTRQEGNINRAVQHLRSAATSLWQGEMVETTFRPKLEQLGQWYRIVARGVEPGSEAHACLERFVTAVDVFNDAIARDDTDHMIQTFDTAVALLKDAASARPRRCRRQHDTNPAIGPPSS